MSTQPPCRSMRNGVYGRRLSLGPRLLGLGSGGGAYYWVPGSGSSRHSATCFGRGLWGWNEGRYVLLPGYGGTKSASYGRDRLRLRI